MGSVRPNVKKREFTPAMTSSAEKELLLPPTYKASDAHPAVPVNPPTYAESAARPGLFPPLVPRFHAKSATAPAKPVAAPAKKTAVTQPNVRLPLVKPVVTPAKSLAALGIHSVTTQKVPVADVKTTLEAGVITDKWTIYFKSKFEDKKCPREQNVLSEIIKQINNAGLAHRTEPETLGIIDEMSIKKKAALINYVYHQLKSLPDWDKYCENHPSSLIKLPDLQAKMAFTPVEIASIFADQWYAYTNIDHIPQSDKPRQSLNELIDWHIYFLQEYLIIILKENEKLPAAYRLCLDVQIMILRIVADFHYSTISIFKPKDEKFDELKTSMFRVIRDMLEPRLIKPDGTINRDALNKLADQLIKEEEKAERGSSLRMVR